MLPLLGMKNIIASLIPDAKAVAAAAIAGGIAALGLDATPIGNGIVGGDWNALHSIALTALTAAVTAGGQAARAILDKLFPPPTP